MKRLSLACGCLFGLLAHNYGMGSWAPQKDVRVGTSRVFLWVIPADASAIKPEPEPQSSESSVPVRPASTPPVSPVSASAPAGRAGG
jgi:hypothetical protein